jgi:hypothetical protein
MAQPNNSDRDLKYLKDRMSRMSSEKITSLHQQALITLLFIYRDGAHEYSDKDIEMYPGLAERNRIVHETVGDYLALQQNMRKILQDRPQKRILSLNF